MLFSRSSSLATYLGTCEGIEGCLMFVHIFQGLLMGIWFTSSGRLILVLCGSWLVEGLGSSLFVLLFWPPMVFYVFLSNSGYHRSRKKKQAPSNGRNK